MPHETPALSDHRNGTAPQTHHEPLSDLPRVLSGGSLARHRPAGESFSEAHLPAAWRSLGLHRVGRAVLLAGERQIRKCLLPRGWGERPREPFLGLRQRRPVSSLAASKHLLFRRWFDRGHVGPKCSGPRRRTHRAALHLPGAHRNCQLVQSQLPDLLRGLAARLRPQSGRRAAGGIAAAHSGRR